MSSEFAMSDLGTLYYFLGISTTRRDDGLFLSQSKYASNLLDRASMSSCNPARTPIEVTDKLSQTGSTPFSDPSYYRSIVGALQYLTFTRPDIAYVVQQVSLFMHSPQDHHFHAVKRILRYIKGTLDYGLIICPSSLAQLVAYSDGDWASCPDTCRSTSGYCIFLEDNLISWFSKRQHTASRSSAEAEYRAVANAIAECCWIRNLLGELHIPLTPASIIFCDNISAMYLSNNPVQHARVKHVELDLHFVRERVALGQARVLHVPFSQQFAYIMTKALPFVLFQDFRYNLNVCPSIQIAGGIDG
ncbi:putative mitochondrial protein [Apostasia shenzhenica]|uniref:Putative mitochondrial protein n=1 Tax=Apostasia shenzhenica TaxID=1088818 RepID=A0A2I0AIU2_9ASPA|nr:putative mitochondrial protein [Apostasia shenzhenica]